VVSQFFGALLRGKALELVEGGHQRRCFTAIEDGLDALMRIIANPGGVANGKIYNIGNPANDLSIAELAELMLAVAHEFPEMQANLAGVSIQAVDQESFYGVGYQDATRRVPNIAATMKDLGWVPGIDITIALRGIFRAHLAESAS
jgi:nucleoside-diphosphate-sugar epimerase